MTKSFIQIPWWAIHPSVKWQYESLNFGFCIRRPLPLLFVACTSDLMSNALCLALSWRATHFYQLLEILDKLATYNHISLLLQVNFWQDLSQSKHFNYPWLCGEVQTECSPSTLTNQLTTPKSIAFQLINTVWFAWGLGYCLHSDLSLPLAAQY